MLVPDIIIAGAPKCGSTSLFDYLAAHPEICPSNVKETYYLMDPGYPLYDESRNYKQQGLNGYAQFFDGPGSDQCLRLEATPDYLYQGTPLDVLPSFNKPPVIIFILRKPSQRIFSLFSFAKHSLALLDQGLTFRDYIDMVKTNDRRLEGKAILQNVIEHSKYHIYLSKWYEKLPAGHIHVYLFENMIADPRKFLGEVARVIGIDESFYQTYSFDARNVTVEPKSRLLQVLRMKASRYFPAGTAKQLMKGLYDRFNLRNKRTPLTTDDRLLLAELDELFEPYNAELSKLTYLSLSEWK